MEFWSSLFHSFQVVIWRERESWEGTGWHHKSKTHVRENSRKPTFKGRRRKSVEEAEKDHAESERLSQGGAQVAGRKAEGGKWAVQVEGTSKVTSIFMGVPEQKVAGAQFFPQWPCCQRVCMGTNIYYQNPHTTFSGSPAKHLAL